MVSKGQFVGLGLEPHRAATQPSNVTELWQNKSEKRNPQTKANRYLLNKYDPTIAILLRQEMVNEGYSLSFGILNGPFYRYGGHFEFYCFK